VPKTCRCQITFADIISQGPLTAEGLAGLALRRLLLRADGLESASFRRIQILKRTRCRALLEDMVEWVVKGTGPPPSQYPHVGDGTLVRATKAAVGFPDIPGVTLKDNFENPLIDYNWGATFDYNDVSGVVSKVPPAIKQVIPLLVPKVNADGNEISGVASVLHQAPLGTYVGWNVIPSGFFKGQDVRVYGRLHSIAMTKEERLAAKDPRPSLEERYGQSEGVRGGSAHRRRGKRCASDSFCPRTPRS